MSQNNLYISYFVAQPTKSRKRQDLNRLLSNEEGLIAYQKNLINDYLSQQSDGLVVESFIDVPEHRRTPKWPQLGKALEACKATGAKLLIAELGNLIGNETFSETILNNNVEFVCCDQPFVDRSVLKILSKHAQILRKQHGKLIREGLKMTSAKSGNPNAAQVISKVNKPKIDTAIVFAFLIQAIISDYRRKGFSQRHMVKNLNDEGFTAPEGGRWVLSQLQKVLERVRLNELATEHKALIEELREKNSEITIAQLCEAFNQRNLISSKRCGWDEDQMRRLLERVQQIQDITRINQFALAIIPVLHDYRQKGFNEAAILADLQQKGFTLTIANEADQPTTNNSPPLPLSREISQLQTVLNNFPRFSQSLEANLESASKHIPAYLKIVKVHIEQLRQVLNSETHNKRGLQIHTLSETIQQLMQLFEILEEEDIVVLENLAIEASEWAVYEDLETNPQTLNTLAAAH